MKSTLFIVLLVAPVSLAQDHSEHSQPAGASEASTPVNGSGTSWLPASSPREMLYFASGAWDFMVHGFANFVYQDESGPRGTSEFFSTNMAMFSAGRTAGKGHFRFRFMTSLEPTLGKTGYPLLFQTGETADSINPLFDRQHPHDVLMEIALRYDRPVGQADSLFVYFAPIGDPALGPSAFMHRAASVDNPVAPLTHHWLDATHITYGVLTVGWSQANRVKFEASIFNGREPDAERWDVDTFKLDSYSARATVNPTPNWTVQGSMGFLKDPEQLHPNQDLLRMTASLTHNKVLGRNSSWGNWQTTAAWGRNKWERPPPVDQIPVGGHFHFSVGPGRQPTRNAVLAETSLRFERAHTVFSRWEWAEKDELFDFTDPRHQTVYDIYKLSFGYLVDFLQLQNARIGVGAYGAFHWIPTDLEPVYGGRPKSFGFFLRLKIIETTHPALGSARGVLSSTWARPHPPIRTAPCKGSTSRATTPRRRGPVLAYLS